MDADDVLTGRMTRYLQTGHPDAVTVAQEVVRWLLHYDGPQTVQAWLLGMNPELDDEAALIALHRGDFDEVRRAARAFIING